MSRRPFRVPLSLFFKGKVVVTSAGIMEIDLQKDAGGQSSRPLVFRSPERWRDKIWRGVFEGVIEVGR